jgi:hypothetical protein
MGIPAINGRPRTPGQTGTASKQGRLFRVAAPIALALVALLPCHADDLVFPEGTIRKLSKAEQKAYARLEPPVGADRFAAPDMRAKKIVSPDGSSWEVPAPRNDWYKGRVWPTIYVPAGEYALSVAYGGFWKTWCANVQYREGDAGCFAGWLGQSECLAVPQLEPDQVTIPWKAEAGTTYTITRAYTVFPPLPKVQWQATIIEKCLWSVTPAPGSGILKTCVSKAKNGDEPAADLACQSAKLYFSAYCLSHKKGESSGPCPSGPQAVLPTPAAPDVAVATPQTRVPTPAAPDAAVATPPTKVPTPAAPDAAVATPQTKVPTPAAPDAAVATPESKKKEGMLAGSSTSVPASMEAPAPVVDEKALQPGMTFQQVEEAIGRPAWRAASGKFARWAYGHFSVYFENGRVVRIESP